MNNKPRSYTYSYSTIVLPITLHSCEWQPAEAGAKVCSHKGCLAGQRLVVPRRIELR